MNKQIFTNIPYLIISPKKYFKESISDKEFITKDLILICVILIPLISLMHFIEANVNLKIKDITQITVYSLAYMIGLTLSFLFRTYFVSVLLKKRGFEIRYQNIGMIIGIAMITNLIMYIIPIIIENNTFNGFIEFMMSIWSLLLILFGIQVLTKIKFFQGFLIVLTMVCFEFLVQLAFTGISI